MKRGMHPNEILLDTELVRRLVSHQFPTWADLPLEFVAQGTVNAMYRLGDDMVVRLPFVERGAGGIGREAIWLPRLAPQLDDPIPTVLGIGEPDIDYPCPWLVLNWLPGNHPVPDQLDDPDRLAADLASFISDLRRLDTHGAPKGYRGGSLAALDAPVRECLGQIVDLIDSAALTAIWEESLVAPAWPGKPVWLHCDLLVGNVLVDGGRLSGILDFATAGIGDPACDLMAAWSILPSASRLVFREALRADDASWARGRGWALSQAAIALPYYRDSNPFMAESSLHILRELERSESTQG
jgi:aminoglycoside phosphotransferase (APT) family kinase protein